MKALFVSLCALGALLGIVACAPSSAEPQASAPPGTYKVEHTDAQWRKLLPDQTYQILRHAETERAFTSALLDEHRKGTFVCAGCGEKLFDSGTKFESGTGWPSFFKALKGAVIERHDTSDGMDRTEILCAQCGGHLGHVFDDGPRPTGLRYCMNGAALKFVPAK